VDAFPERKVNAVVYEIANTGRSKGLGTQEEVTNFTVKMRVVDKDVPLRPGMSMTADVETETKANVLSVPIQSVTTRMPKPEVKEPEAESGQAGAAPPPQQQTAAKRQERPKEIVFVVESGAVKAVQVKRGISNDSHVEIVEGVTEGMEIVSGSYRAINRELEDGSKVRVEEAKKQPGKPKGEGA
jgi:HlyD family secretion protein